jgi:hypothetical protein
MEMHQEAPKFSEQDSVAVGAVRAGDPERYRELVERKRAVNPMVPNPN